jgi:hypothetical protein
LKSIYYYLYKGIYYTIVKCAIALSISDCTSILRLGFLLIIENSNKISFFPHQFFHYLRGILGLFKGRLELEIRECPMKDTLKLAMIP